jgi:hypothetical protein
MTFIDARARRALTAIIGAVILTALILALLVKVDPAGADGHDDGTPVATQAEVDALRADVDAGGAERVRLSARIDALEAGATESARIIGELTAKVANLEHYARQTRSAVGGKDVWARLAQCESGGDPRAHSKSGAYHGAFQFSLSTWRSVGGPGDPHEHPYAVQRHYAQVLQARSGWGQWPACSRALGLR